VAPYSIFIAKLEAVKKKNGKTPVDQVNPTFGIAKTDNSIKPKLSVVESCPATNIPPFDEQY
jgi:hypothetical protein